MHYQRWWKHGDPLAGVTEGCAVEGCDRPHQARGLCGAHYGRKRYAEKRADVLAAQKAWREQNREVKAARDRDYRNRNEDKIAEQRRAYYRRNRDAVRAATRARNAQSYADAKAEGRCAWMHGRGCNQDALPGLTKCADHRAAQDAYNARYHSAVNDKSYVERGIDGSCWMCRGAFTADNPRQHDHLIPASRGGPDDTWNMAPACRVCNIRRGNKPLAATVATLYPAGMPEPLRAVIDHALEQQAALMT